VDGRVSYEALAAGAAFQAVLGEVAALARAHRPLLMCAERDPARCHRQGLVGVRLAALGTEVVHILADGRLEPAAHQGRLGL